MSASTFLVKNNNELFCLSANIGGVFISGTASAGDVLMTTGPHTAIWGPNEPGGATVVDTAETLVITNASVAGQILTGTGAGGAQWAAPTIPSGSTLVNATLTNPTITTPTITGAVATASSNNLIARGLFDSSGAGSVSTYASTAPTTGSVLMATSPTTAVWSTPSVIDIGESQLVIQNATTGSGKVLTDSASGQATWTTATIASGSTITNPTLTGAIITSSTNNVLARGLFTGSGSGSVSTFAATAPASGAVLTATGASAAVWSTPSLPSGSTITNPTITGATLTTSTLTDPTDNVLARGLWDSSGSGSVSTYASTAPTAGYVLTATSGTTAVWAPPSASGSVLTAKVTINSTQLATIHGSAVTLVAAPGAGQVLIPLNSYAVYTYSTSPYTNASNSLELYYGAYALDSDVGDLDSAALLGSVNAYVFAPSGGNNSATDVSNMALVASSPGNFVGGLGSITVYLQYVVMTL